MNNILLLKNGKAGVFVCLFLWCTLPSTARDWTFDVNTGEAYHLVLNLQLEEARQKIPLPETPQDLYVIALAEALELLITEDGEKFTEYQERFRQRIDRKIKMTEPDDLFLSAELHLQWAFVYLKFGHEFDAALNFRQSYQLVQDIKKQFPQYMAIKKTSGLLNVIIGSIPEKYGWVLALLNIEGTVDLGLEELESISTSTHPLAFETSLLAALTEGFLLQQPGAALKKVRKHLEEDPSHRLSLFLAAGLAIKNAESESALSMLQLLSQSPGLPLYFADYLMGEVYLYKGEYLNSIAAFHSFINHYKGQQHIKDSYYKIGLCYWLNGNKNDALYNFKEARKKGKESSEADKYAARSLSDTELPHILLTKARYFTDGGYYQKAEEILNRITPAHLPTKRDEVEHAYRKARLAHKTDDLQKAKAQYIMTIDVNGQGEWYFAPNACLQMGYILQEENDTTGAKNYFSRALRYKDHEYKNSIDSKAKSALAHLKERK